VSLFSWTRRSSHPSVLLWEVPLCPTSPWMGYKQQAALVLMFLEIKIQFYTSQSRPWSVVETVAIIFLALLLFCRLPFILALLFLAYCFVSLLSASVDVWCMFPFLPFIMIALNAFHYSSAGLNYRKHACVLFHHSSHSLRPHLTQNPAVTEWA